MLTTSFYFEQRACKCVKKGEKYYNGLKMYRIYYFFFFFYIFTPSTLVMTGKSSSQDRQYRLPRGPGASYFVFFPSRAQKLDYYFSDFVSARFGFFYHITYILFIALVATRITSPTTHPYTVPPPAAQRRRSIASSAVATLHAVIQGGHPRVFLP